jgi:hypothetical protein
MKTITKLIYPAFALTCFALSPIVQAVTRHRMEVTPAKIQRRAMMRSLA